MISDLLLWRNPGIVLLIPSHCQVSHKPRVAIKLQNNYLQRHWYISRPSYRALLNDNHLEHMTDGQNVINITLFTASFPIT